jgi:hypothetical protein
LKHIVATLFISSSKATLTINSINKRSMIKSPIAGVSEQVLNPYTGKLCLHRSLLFKILFDVVYALKVDLMIEAANLILQKYKNRALFLE